MKPSLLRPVALALTVLAIGRPAIAAGPCHMRVLVTLAEPVAGRIPQSVLDDIAHRARVRLSYERTIGSRFQLLDLASNELDPDCTAALDRLRADARIHSLERDARRRVHEPLPAASPR